MNRAQLSGIRQRARELQKAREAEQQRAGSYVSLIERVIHGGLWSYVGADGHESSEATEAGFKWSGCERCNQLNGGRVLGMSVYTVTGYETLEDAQAGAGNLYEFDLCGECIYTLTYGEG